MVGISIGCILGMFPLLFFESEKRPEEEPDKVSSPTSAVPEKSEKTKPAT